MPLLPPPLAPRRGDVPRHGCRGSTNSSNPCSSMSPCSHTCSSTCSRKSLWRNLRRPQIRCHHRGGGGSGGRRARNPSGVARAAEPAEELAEPLHGGAATFADVDIFGTLRADNRRRLGDVLLVGLVGVGQGTLVHGHCSLHRALSQSFCGCCRSQGRGVVECLLLVFRLRRRQDVTACATAALNRMPLATRPRLLTLQRKLREFATGQQLVLLGRGLLLLLDNIGNSRRGRRWYRLRAGQLLHPPASARQPGGELGVHRCGPLGHGADIAYRGLAGVGLLTLPRQALLQLRV
mmetsp:Transcript_53770/g.135784  ORF Transcript_53770/g.135784 Transcript_53770/m.135784 type:complete len:293 (+) Transcript_53770:1514-2392(+)